MGGRFIDGTWTVEKTWENKKDGSFKRQESVFRHPMGLDTPYPAESGRYHLYVSYACPWAHRTLMTRALMGLEECISVSSVHPLMTDDGWHFSPEDPHYPCSDDLFAEPFLRNIYLRADPTFTGRVTVPILWDKKTNTLLNNESSEIIREFTRHFGEFSTRESSLYPPSLQSDVDAAMDAIYRPINNGVYRCGFAGNQEVYNQALGELFAALDHWDKVLGQQRFMTGDTLTLADLALFATLIRFDSVYYVHFKTNIRHIYEYPHLWRFVREVYNTPHVAEITHIDQIKEHYFRSHPHLNPKGFIPGGPHLHLT